MSEEIKFKYDMEFKPGEATMHVELGAEDKELFFQLFNSRGWKLYSKMVSTYAQGVLNSLIAMDDPVKIQKNLGIVAGCNFAVNSLGIQVSQFKKTEAKRVAAETKKQPKPFR